MIQNEEQLLSFGHGSRDLTLEFNKSADVQNMNRLLACVYVIYKANYSAKFLFIIENHPRGRGFFFVLDIILSCSSAWNFKCFRTEQQLCVRQGEASLCKQKLEQNASSHTVWLFQGSNWWPTACFIWISAEGNS